MVALAYENAYDHAILISGDEDFTPAVEIAQQKGKIVTIVSARGMASSVLGIKSDRVIYFNEGDQFSLGQFLVD